MRRRTRCHPPGVLVAALNSRVCAGVMSGQRCSSGELGSHCVSGGILNVGANVGPLQVLPRSSPDLGRRETVAAHTEEELGTCHGGVSQLPARFGWARS